MAPNRPAFIPRLFASDPQAMAALEHLLQHPEELRSHLMLACGYAQGRGLNGAAAAVLIAADRLGLISTEDV